eukprot:1145907-Pelagomonas_calceolata.AAC.3
MQQALGIMHLSIGGSTSVVAAPSLSFQGNSDAMALICGVQIRDQYEGLGYVVRPVFYSDARFGNQHPPTAAR